jgi:hypothetical protein
MASENFIDKNNYLEIIDFIRERMIVLNNNDTSPTDIAKLFAKEETKKYLEGFNKESLISLMIFFMECPHVLDNI